MRTKINYLETLLLKSELNLCRLRYLFSLTEYYNTQNVRVNYIYVFVQYLIIFKNSDLKIIVVQGDTQSKHTFFIRLKYSHLVTILFEIELKLINYSNQILNILGSFTVINFRNLPYSFQQ